VIVNNWKKLLDGLEKEHQLPAVLEQRSTVVSAGAGSGKTRVLAIRYLHLVKNRGIPPDRILCLTFSRKAAAEMSERIRGMLVSCAEDDADFARALAVFPLSRVSTLDSFCAEIARNGCARWGIAPDFTIDETMAEEALKAYSIDFLLAKRHEPVAASFIAAAGFENAVNALLALSGGRTGLVIQGNRFDHDTQSRRLAESFRDVHTRLFDLLHGGLGLDRGELSSVKVWIDTASKIVPDIPESSDLPELLKARAMYLAISGLRRPGSNTGGASAQYYNLAGEEAKALAAAAALACDALLDERRPGAMQFLKDFTGGAADARAASGRLAFADVAAMAVEILSVDTILRDWYKSRWDAVMVDEFQDDNELQKRLLYLVAERRDAPARLLPEGESTVRPENLEPGVLFFVGDEKQSIYAFRGADVTVFRGLSDSLARTQGGLGAHELETNWRSEPGLIDFFNRTFSRIMPAPNDPEALDYEARFVALGAGPATTGVEPMVQYMESNEPDDDSCVSSGEAEAWHIAELVRSLVDQGTMVSAKGPQGVKVARPCHYDDIAVLFKATASQNVVERYFRLYGIPYTATSTAGLYTESIFGDLYAMLRLAVYPDDRLAFATVLRSPFARLSDDDVFCAMNPGAQGALGLMGLDPATLSNDGAERFAVVRETWLGLRERADRIPLCQVLEYLWYDRGLRWNVLKDPESAAFLEHFDYAWDMAQTADSRDERLSDLVAALETRIGSVERYEEGSIARESSRGVSIMTVHLSKGLEFPVVILPDLENTGRNTPGTPVAASGRFGPSLRMLDANAIPVDPVAGFDKALQKIKRGKGAEAMDESLAETARLFYVACTRAISRLYLVGKVTRTSDEAGKSFRGLLLRAWPWAGPQSTKDEEFDSTRPDDAPPAFSIGYVEQRTKIAYARLASGASADGRQRAIASSEAQSWAVAERKWRWSVTGASERLGRTAIEAAQGMPQHPEITQGLPEVDFGTLCHQFVESLLEHPSDQPEAFGTVAVALSRLSAAARQEATGDALRLARAFIASDRGQAASRARDKAGIGIENSIFELEYPFVWHGKNKNGQKIILNGAMDLVYGDKQEVVVVDFKTDKAPDPEKHAFQLSVYREAAESIFGVPTKAFVVFLRSGKEYEVTVSPDISEL
jgi:ATP-dependent exoDNAse (exonuclease V) beta subunit